MVFIHAVILVFTIRSGEPFDLDLWETPSERYLCGKEKPLWWDSYGAVYDSDILFEYDGFSGLCVVSCYDYYW